MTREQAMQIDAYRDELGRKIAEVARNCADAYKRNISQSNTTHENDVHEKCAIAASNTGWFLLTALGYSNDQIKQFMNTATER